MTKRNVGISQETLDKIDLFLSLRENKIKYPSKKFLVDNVVNRFIDSQMGVNWLHSKD